MVAIVALAYMRIFLPDSTLPGDLTSPIIVSKRDGLKCSAEDSSNSMQVFRTVPSFDDMVGLVKSSATFLQAAVVAFFSNLADVGLQASMMVAEFFSLSGLSTLCYCSERALNRRHYRGCSIT